MSKLSKTQQNCVKRLANSEISKSIRTSGASSYDRHLWKIYSVELRQSKSFIKGKSLFMANISKTICAHHLCSYTIDGKAYFDYSPKECFRLMGVKDEDYEKVAENQSNSSLYHLAGDSIITTVLMAIFGQMVCKDYKNYLWEIKNESSND